jgi:hypothetical protein
MNPKIQKFIFLANTLTVLGKKEGQPKVDLQANWPQYLLNHDLVWNKIPKDYFEGDMGISMLQGNMERLG